MGNLESKTTSHSTSSSSLEESTQTQTNHPKTVTSALTMESNNNKHPSKISGYMEFFTHAGRTISDASGIVCGAIEDTFEGEDKYANRKREERLAGGSGSGSGSGSRSKGRGSRNGGGATGNGGKHNGERNENALSSSTSSDPKQSQLKQPQSQSQHQHNDTDAMSALFARALLSEVTHPHPSNNPTNPPNKTTNRTSKPSSSSSSSSPSPHRPQTLPPSLLAEHRAQIRPSNSLLLPPPILPYHNHHPSPTPTTTPTTTSTTRHRITIGLSLSRHHPTLGHPDTITRQTAFDLNELQDRNYRYVSSTDSDGWRAGGGEPPSPHNHSTPSSPSDPNHNHKLHKTPAPDTVHIPILQIDCTSPSQIDLIITALARGEIFIPHMAILPTNLSVYGGSPPDLGLMFRCERNEDVPPDQWPNWCLEFMHNQLYEYFQPILGGGNGGNGGNGSGSGTHGGEENHHHHSDDGDGDNGGGSGTNSGTIGAQWTPRPFQVTLARKVRWKTVKHMNKFFERSEKALLAWRDRGPKLLSPGDGTGGSGSSSSNNNGAEGSGGVGSVGGGGSGSGPTTTNSPIEGTSPEETIKPHGIYLLRNGKPTNYFPPNFEPPYTTKMTRSLITNVLEKSWDKKRRDWASTQPMAVSSLSASQTVMSSSAGMMLSHMCGCSDVGSGGSGSGEYGGMMEGGGGGGGGGSGGGVVGGMYFGDGGDYDKDLSGRVIRQQIGIGALDNDASVGGDLSVGGGGGGGDSSAVSSAAAAATATIGNNSDPGKDELLDKTPKKNVGTPKQRHSTSTSSSGRKKERSSKKKQGRDGDRTGGGVVVAPTTPTSTSTMDNETNYHNNYMDHETNYHNNHIYPSESSRTSSVGTPSNATTTPTKDVNRGGNGRDDGVAQQLSFETEFLSEQDDIPKRRQNNDSLDYGPDSLLTSNQAVDETERSDTSDQYQYHHHHYQQQQQQQEQQQEYEQEHEEQEPKPRHKHKKSKKSKKHKHLKHQKQQQPTQPTEFRQRNPVISERIPEDAEAEHHHHHNKNSNHYHHHNHHETTDFYISPDQLDTSTTENPSTPSRVLMEVDSAIAGHTSFGATSSIGGNTSTGESQTISIGESHTTIPTMNGSSAKFIEQERERRKQREAEREKERRKIEQLELAIQEKMQNGVGGRGDVESEDVGELEEQEAMRKVVVSKEKKRERKDKKKKREKKDRDKYNRESSEPTKHNSSSHRESLKTVSAEAESDEAKQETRQQPQDYESKDLLMPQLHVHNENVPNQKEEERDGFSGCVQPVRDSSYLPLNLDAPMTTNHIKTNLYGNPQTRNSPDISSQISLDYSMDTASLLGDGSLIGGQFAGDGSVITLGTQASENRSLLSCVTRSTVHEASPTSGWNRNGGVTDTINESDADDISLSLLASSSSTMEPAVPTDKELFAIGWAKAMDKKSGSYYYFTLDRKKTVWDNPLKTSSKS